MAVGKRRLGYVLRKWSRRCFDAVDHFFPGRTRKRRGATVFGYLRAESGLGEAARRVFLSLRHVGYPVSAKSLPIPVFEQNDSTLGAEMATTPSSHRIHIFHLNADTTLDLERIIKRRDLRGRYKIGIWTWELPQLPSAWHRAADILDEIWVPSDFVRRAVAPITKKPVLVFPHAVPELRAPKTARKYFGIDPNVFVILITIDLNSYIARKNPVGAVEAVRRAFMPDYTGIHMIVKMHGRDRALERAAVLQAVQHVPGAKVIDRVLSRQEMTLLQAACDTYLSLHRSEGFGLCIAECMALGKLVIATNYSGNCDYLDRTCGAPVDFSLCAVKSDQYPYAEGQSWAEPDLSHAAQLIRRAFEDPEWRVRTGERARERVAQTLSLDVVGRLMRERLERIDDQLHQGICRGSRHSLLQV